jgi:hypothetical protein
MSTVVFRIPVLHTARYSHDHNSHLSQRNLTALVTQVIPHLLLTVALANLAIAFVGLLPFPLLAARQVRALAAAVLSGTADALERCVFQHYPLIKSFDAPYLVSYLC